MLAHRIHQYTARTPPLHPTSRVLCRQATFHQFLRPFHHTLPRYTSDWRSPEQIGDREPRLNWIPGSGSNDEQAGKEGSSSKWKYRAEALRREEQRKVAAKEPILDWISGSGPSNLPKTTGFQGVNLLDIKDPELPWLPSIKQRLEPQLNWEQTSKRQSGRSLRSLLIQGIFEKTRRRRGGVRKPLKGLVTRYTTFPKPRGLTRKVVSNQRNASILNQELKEPSITIGQSPVLGDKLNPKLREHRLAFNPFEDPQTPGPEAIQDFLKPNLEVSESIKVPKPTAAHLRPLLRKIAIGRENRIAVNAVACRRVKDREKSKNNEPQDKRSETLNPFVGSKVSTEKDLSRKEVQLHVPLVHYKYIAKTKEIPETRKNIQPLQKYTKSSKPEKRVSAIPERLFSSRSIFPKETTELKAVTFKSSDSNKSLFRRIDTSRPFKRFIPRGALVETQSLILPENTIQRSKMDESSATNRIMEEAVPNSTNIEIPAAGEETAPKPDLKRVFNSPARKTGNEPNKKQRPNKKKKKPLKSSAKVLLRDIETFRSKLNLTEDEIEAAVGRLPEPFTELELTVTELSSIGDGLAVHDNHVYIVPFSLPGDKVQVKIRFHDDTHTETEFIKVLTPSPDRDDSLIGCKYFASCSGCQFQMLSYDKQLEHKRSVVQKAFANYSNLPAELLPPVLETMGSPMQYGYRTKLTPHFDGPRKGFKPDAPIPNIGFGAKGSRRTLDIEDCPIGTDAIREGMKRQRAWVQKNLHTYKTGATLLLRESTERVPIEGATEVDGEGKNYVETKKCVTDFKERSVEYFGDFRFDSPAGSFFQNNNSILTNFTDYIRESLNFPIVKQAGDTSETVETRAPKYLVDAYCGSGLFTVACGQGLEKVVGVDLDKQSIASARENARMNNIQNATFISGNAEAIFAEIKFPGSETSLIIDPPRKGCDKLFLDQLLDFQPRRVVYVSCDVHTQARDIGYILNDKKGEKYRVDSIKGFDFFPQTHHVEGVAVLTLID